MKKLSISEHLARANSLMIKRDVVDYLRLHHSVPLTQILKMAFDKDLVWLLPEGNPPYTPCPNFDQDGALYSEARRLYLFHENGKAGLTQRKREQLFVQMLEFLSPDDAKLIIAVKDKKLPYEYITQEVVNEAFPGLLVY